MHQQSDPKMSPKSHALIKVRVDFDLLEKFDLVRPAQISSREQALRVLMRQAINTNGAQLLSPVQDLPEFEMLTFQQAREWLAPYYAGKPPSFDTLERRIADGILIATKESNARTGRRRILKSSLVAWMRRLGKQLHEEMM